MADEYFETVRTEVDTSLRAALGDDGVVSRIVKTYPDGRLEYGAWSGAAWALEMLGYSGVNEG